MNRISFFAFVVKVTSFTPFMAFNVVLRVVTFVRSNSLKAGLAASIV